MYEVIDEKKVLQTAHKNVGTLHIIDTTNLSVKKLREEIQSKYFSIYDELIKTVIILLKGEAVFPLSCVSICPLLQQINQP